MSEAIATGAIGLMGVILVILLHQCFKLHELWRMALTCQKNSRWARICKAENRELRSALRAEKAHIEQLQRKLVILQASVPAEG